VVLGVGAMYGTGYSVISMMCCGSGVLLARLCIRIGAVMMEWI
jgi:hypothetical protein